MKKILWWPKYFSGDRNISLVADVFFLAWNIVLVMKAIVKWLNEVFFLTGLFNLVMEVSALVISKMVPIFFFILRKLNEVASQPQVTSEVRPHIVHF